MSPKEEQTTELTLFGVIALTGYMSIQIYAPWQLKKG